MATPGVRYASISAAIGHTGLRPSGPKTEVVIPCMTRLCARRPSMLSDAKERSACECMSMKPGTMYFPVASMMRVGGGGRGARPMEMITSSVMAMSAV